MKRTDCLYTPYYCEENIYYLLGRPEFAHPPTWVIFVSNARRSVLMEWQAAGGGGPLVWDYHVVLVAPDDTGPTASFGVYDLDSVLPFPTELSSYCDASFPQSARRDFSPCFRVIPGNEYLATFASDRRHMRDRYGRYQQPPPPWPPIRPELGSNLDSFLSLSAEGPGDVATRSELGSLLRRRIGLD